MPTIDRTVQVPIQPIAVQLRARSYDPEAGTVDVVIHSGERVLRRNWQVCDTPFWEELSMEPGAIRMGRLNSGRMSVLDNHGYANGATHGPELGQTANIVGVVVQDSGHVESVNGRQALVGTIRLSQVPELASLRTKVEEGILSSVSGAYQPWRYELREIATDGLPVYRVVDWEPYEVSLLGLPAEEGACLRSAALSSSLCSIVDRRADLPGSPPMPPPNDPVQTPAAAAPVLQPVAPVATPEASRARQDQPVAQPAADSEAIRQSATLAERTRSTEIRQLVQRAALPADFAQPLIDSGVSAERASVQILDELARRSGVATPGAPAAPTSGAPASAPETRSTVPAQARSIALQPVGETPAERENDAIAIALQHRSRPDVVPISKLPDQSRRFATYSLLDLVAHCLERRGSYVRGEQKDSLVRRGLLATSDFPEILANTANRSLRSQYDVQPNTWSAFCRRGTLPDFKQTSRAQLGGAPALTVVPETGVVERGAISEQAEKYQLATYGKILPISRQAIINDDLSAFTRIPAQFAVSASVLIEDLVYAILTTNGNMADAVALFATAHKNLSTGAGSALTAANEAGLAAARALMRNQTGLDGKYLNFSPSILLVPTALETVAERLVAAVQPVTSAGVNPFAGKLRVVTNPRLDVASAVHWYAIVDPSMCDTIEVGFLDGSDGPRIETRQGFDVEGVEIKCMLDVGAKAIDWRGMVRSNGS